MINIYPKKIKKMQFAEKKFRINSDDWSPADFADLRRLGLNILAPTWESLFQNALSASFTVFCGAKVGAFRAILSYLKNRKE